MNDRLKTALTPENNQTFPVSKFDQVMQDLLLKQASGLVGIAGDTIWESSTCAGWAETCQIVASPMAPITKPEALNEFMFSLTDVPYTSVDRSYRHGSDSSLSIPKLYFDEELAKIHRTIHASVDQLLAFKTDLRLDTSSKQETTEILKRRTWLYVYPDPTSAEIAHKIMTGEYEADLTTFSTHHLSPNQVRLIEKNQNRGFLRRLRGK